MTNKGKKRIFRRIRNGLILTGILCVGVWALGLFYARPMLEGKIRKAFAKATANRYLLSFDELELSYSGGGIIIRNLHIKPNPDSLAALRENGLLELQCAEASVKEIKFWKTFWGPHFSAGSLLLESPRLTLWNKNGVRKTPSTERPKKNFGQLDLDKIYIRNAQTQVRDKDTDRFLFGTESFSLFVDEFGLTDNLVPVYRHFTLESYENSVRLFGNREFKLEKLFLTGGPEYTGLNATGFDISEIDSALHKTFRIPEEITFSLQGISLESESLADLAEQIIEGKTQDIHIRKLLLMEPRVGIRTARPAAGRDTAEAGTKIEKVTRKLALPSVEQAGILNGRFTWRENGTAQPVLDVEHIHLMATGLRPRMGEKIPLLFSTAEVSVGQTVFAYPRADYYATAKSVQYRTVTDSLKIDGFRFLPHRSVDSFYLDKQWRTDRFEFLCDTVHIQNMHLADFVRHDAFTPEQVVFKSPEIKVYTDKRLQHDPKFVKPFPVQKLRGIGGHYAIGSILFENGTATYTERVANTPGTGTLKMTQARFEIRDIKSHPTPADTLRLDYRCSFGEESYGEIFIDIPLYGNDEIQYGRGMIKHLPFKQLNSITENTVLMGFASGELDSCWFSFKAVNGKAEGRSVFYYNNLKVKIYKSVLVPSYQKHVLMGKTFMSLVANLIINKNNPTEEGYSLPGKLEFERDKQKGPLNFWIRTIMTGLMNTVVDDISELKDLQEEIRSLKSSSKTGLLSKMKGNPFNKKKNKQDTPE